MADGDTAAAIAGWSKVLDSDDLRLAYVGQNRAADLAFKYGPLSFANATALLAYTSGVATYQQAVDRATGDVYRWSGTAWQLWSTGWKAYTPTFSGLTVGNGTLAFVYRYQDGSVYYAGSFTFGSTSAVTGALLVSFPVDMAGTVSPLIGQARALATGNPMPLYAARSNASQLRLRYMTGSAAVVGTGDFTSTLPVTFATGHSIEFHVLYRVY